jgi:DNA-binding Lrp family transcriptional regulator
MMSAAGALFGMAVALSLCLLSCSRRAGMRKNLLPRPTVEDLTRMKTKHHDTDELDAHIIDELTRDVERSNKYLANKFHVSESTIANRIRLMRQRGVMHVTAQRDLYSLGYMFLGFAEIFIHTKNFGHVTSEITKIKDVISVSGIVGNPQIVIQFNSRDRRDTIRILHDEIGSIRGVVEIRSHLTLRVVKFEPDFGGLLLDASD